MPAISAIMTTYNGQEFISETIESILNQTFQEFEFIIIDDCSTDNTADIIKSCNDSRIKLFVLKENVGVGAALTFGLEKAAGQYVAKVDSDDIYALDRFQKQKEFLDDNSHISLLKSFIEYFPHDKMVEKSERYNFMKKVKENDLNSVITPEQIREQLYWWCCVPHNSIMVRTNVIKNVGYDNIRFGEDYKLLYLLNKHNEKMDTFREVLVKFRVRQNSLTGSAIHQEEYINTVFEIKRDEIKDFLNNNKKLFIWGTGNLGKIVFKKLKKEGYDIDGFIERNINMIGKNIEGVRIYGEEVLDVMTYSSLKILICAQPIRTEIINKMTQRGYKPIENYFVFL